MSLIYWNCPYCDALNMDDTELTSIPMCGECEKDVHWDEAYPFETEHEDTDGCCECGSKDHICQACPTFFK